MPRPKTNAIRTTLSLRQRDLDHLENVAKATKLSPNDAMRKALATEAFIQDVLKTGGRLLIENPSGEIRQVEFVGV